MANCINKSFIGHLEERSNNGSYMFKTQISFIQSFMPWIVIYGANYLGADLRKCQWKVFEEIYYNLDQSVFFDILPYIIGIILENFPWKYMDLS